MIDEVKLKNFLDTVIAMRNVQKSFFKTKDRALIPEARRLEISVDMRTADLAADLDKEKIAGVPGRSADRG